MSQIVISPVRWTDAPDLIEANAANRGYHAPWVEPFIDMDGFETWFGQRLTGPNVSLVARDEYSRAIVGVLNFSQIVWGPFRSAYLGFYGMVTFSRRGLMTEALRLTAHYAFQEIGLHRLEANVQPENHASIALITRVGFRKEGFSPKYLQVGGVWCDHETLGTPGKRLRTIERGTRNRKRLIMSSRNVGRCFGPGRRGHLDFRMRSTTLPSPAFAYVSARDEPLNACLRQGLFCGK
jgi:[ribosomal protein S5]-alanine N-acetyltransferase